MEPFGPGAETEACDDALGDERCVLRNDTRTIAAPDDHDGTNDSCEGFTHVDTHDRSKVCRPNSTGVCPEPTGKSSDTLRMNEPHAQQESEDPRLSSGQDMTLT